MEQGCFLKIFLGLCGFIDSAAEEGDRREREWHAAQGPGPGVEPGSAAARTQPLYTDAALPSELNGAAPKEHIFEFIETHILYFIYISDVH